MIESGSRPIVANGVRIGLDRQLEQFESGPVGSGTEAPKEKSEIDGHSHHPCLAFDCELTRLKDRKHIWIRHGITEL